MYRYYVSDGYATPITQQTIFYVMDVTGYLHWKPNHVFRIQLACQMYRILLNDIFMSVGSKSFNVTSVTQDCISFKAWRRVNNGRKWSKAIPVTGYGDPDICETLWLTYFLDNQLTDGAKVCQPHALTIFYPQEDSWYSFLSGGLEGLCQLNNPMTSSRTEPVTSLLVAQGLMTQWMSECESKYYPRKA
jgi:hypothetical protein